MQGMLALEGFTNDVWLWFILSIDLVSVTFYTIPTSIYFFREKVFKILVGKFLGAQSAQHMYLQCTRLH